MINSIPTILERKLLRESETSLRKVSVCLLDTEEENFQLSMGIINRRVSLLFRIMLVILPAMELANVRVAET